MYKVLLAVLILAGLEVVRVTPYTLTMSPQHMHVSPPNQTVTFTCSADEPLTGCEFRWWDGDYNTEGPLLNLSLGPQSRADPENLNLGLTGYSYSGRGLEAGDCGLSLELRGEKLLMVACRVHTVAAGWKYAWGDLYAKHWAPLPHTLTPREAVVLPGGEVAYMLKAPEPLVWCSFDLPDWTKLNFRDGAESDDSFGRHRYLGAGLDSGECGLKLSDISEADNGPTKGYARTSGKNDYRFMPLIVASAPTAPTLTLVYRGGEVTATCDVPESRPVADITWALDDDVIRQDDTHDSPADTEEGWRWPWVKGGIQQRVTISLTPQLNGKTLKCRVSHVTLDEPLEATEIISTPE